MPEDVESMKTLTIILTDGPYISEYAEMAYKIASEALKVSQVNIFLYLDAVHIAKVGQKPSLFGNAGQQFQELAERGCSGQGLRQVCCSQRLSGRGGWQLPGLSPGNKDHKPL